MPNTSPDFLSQPIPETKRKEPEIKKIAFIMRDGLFYFYINRSDNSVKEITCGKWKTLLDEILKALRGKTITQTSIANLAIFFDVINE